MTCVDEDFERCYRAVESRDPRFDGWFFTAVTSTHIYCRPSCPAVTPRRQNVRFFSTAAAAQSAGFRACLRCRPDAAPGSPAWLGRKDVAARALRLVLDGVVDREGVSGVARRLGYSERQLHRVLMAEVGTGAIQLARAQRAQTARLLIETTDLPISEVAFGAGFSSIRQFNDTVREVFGRTPSQLRYSRHTGHTGDAGHTASGRKQVTPRSLVGEHGRRAQKLTVRLACRSPFAGDELIEYFRPRGVPGVEQVTERRYERTLRLSGECTVALELHDGFVQALFSLDKMSDLPQAISRCRHLLDLDADPVAVDEQLGADTVIGHLVKAVPGRRVPHSVDGWETAARTVLGQQVSVSSARRAVHRFTVACGEPLAEPIGRLSHMFPAPEKVASLDQRDHRSLGLTSSRLATVVAVARAVADGDVELDHAAEPDELEERLTSIKGIGPWSAAYITMRVVGHPDAFVPTDSALQRGLKRLGVDDARESAADLAGRWAPWRSYAAAHVWSVATEAAGRADAADARSRKGEDAA